MRSPITDDLPMILETPPDENNENEGYKNEIKLLYEIALCAEESQLIMPKWMEEYWLQRETNKPVKKGKTAVDEHGTTKSKPKKKVKRMTGDEGAETLPKVDTAEKIDAASTVVTKIKTSSRNRSRKAKVNSNGDDIEDSSGLSDAPSD
jgi:hypothetical protein